MISRMTGSILASRPAENDIADVVQRLGVL
jgi:hypothetical protein